MIDKGMKVLLVGDYPPPYGGVSVQVSGLRCLLSGRPGITCRVLDIGKSRHQRRPECLCVRGPLGFVWKLLSHALRQYIIHLHTNGHNLKSWLICLTCGAAGTFNGRKTVVSIGSGLAPDFIQRAGSPTRVLIKISLALQGAIICRNERTRTTMVGLEIPAEKIVILPGFYGVRIDQPQKIPWEIEQFLHCSSPVLAAIASPGPEYGIPLVVEAATHLRPFYPRLGLLLIGSGGIENHGLNGNLLVTGELPHDVVLGVMRKVNVFVRPTYFDGDASSVREALALGVPVVASDTESRPEGVILFRRGDSGDLLQKITQALKDRVHVKDSAQDHGSGSLEQLLEVYRRFTGRAVSTGGIP